MRASHSSGERQNDSPPEVSVVLPARNAANTIADQIRALINQRYDGDLEIVVVDNASTDGTGKVIEGIGTSGKRTVRLVRESIPGLNKARNAGVAACVGRYVLLCDADDIVDPDWANEMIKRLKDVDYVGGRLDYLALNAPAVRRMWQVADSLLPSESAFPVGANCGFTREMWVSLGGFDERLSGSGDECEFFWRARSQGYAGAMVSSAIVHYRLRAKPGQMAKRMYRAGRHQVRLSQICPAVARIPELREMSRTFVWICAKAPLAAISITGRSEWLRVTALTVGRAVEMVNQQRIQAQCLPTIRDR